MPHEIALKYLGKKSNFKFVNERVGEIQFGPDPVWIPASHAEWLMEVNPKMFEKTDERGAAEPIEDAADIIGAKSKAEIEAEDDAMFEPEPDAEQEPEPDIGANDEDKQPPDPAGELVCPKCGKEYRDKTWLDKHIATCKR